MNRSSGNLLSKILAALAVGSLLFAPASSAKRRRHKAAFQPAVAAFSRLDYGAPPTVSAAAGYRFMVLGYPPSTQSQAKLRQLISSIHASSPQTRILLYKTIYISPGDTQGINTCARWNRSLPYGGVPMSWFLRGSGGSPLYNSTYGTYWLDPGNRAVQKACESSAISMAKSLGYDGIYWDMISTSLFWAQLPGGCTTSACTSNAHWHAAMASYVRHLSAALHARRLLSIGNVSGGGVAKIGGGGPAYWHAFMRDGLDGAMEESFTSGTNGLPVPLTQWKQELANEAWSEAHGKYLIGNADVTSNQALNTYGLATLLLAARGRSSWATDSGNPMTGNYQFPSYDSALALGSPTGSYSVQRSGLYVRHFRNGTVIVNPTGRTITDKTYGTLGPHSGLIL